MPQPVVSYWIAPGKCKCCGEPAAKCYREFDRLYDCGSGCVCATCSCAQQHTISAHENSRIWCLHPLVCIRILPAGFIACSAKRTHANENTYGKPGPRRQK